MQIITDAAAPQGVGNAFAVAFAKEGAKIAICCEKIRLRLTPAPILSQHLDQGWAEPAGRHLRDLDRPCDDFPAVFLLCPQQQERGRFFLAKIEPAIREVIRSVLSIIRS